MSHTASAIIAVFAFAILWCWYEMKNAPMAVTCPDCNGSRSQMEGTRIVECPTCMGEGSVLEYK